MKLRQVIGPSEPIAKTPWPKSLPEQIAAVRTALTDLGTATPEQVARQFQRARASSVQPLLESLTALGHSRLIEGGRFAARPYFLRRISWNWQSNQLAYGHHHLPMG